jgi:hypothetical protein
VASTLALASPAAGVVCAAQSSATNDLELSAVEFAVRTEEEHPDYGEGDAGGSRDPGCLLD